MFKAHYNEAYRAAARYFDASAYPSVTRELRTAQFMKIISLAPEVL